MTTARELIDQLIKELTEDHNDEKVPETDKNRALNKDLYLEALLKMQELPTEYATIISTIAKASNLTATAIKQQVKTYKEKMASEANKPKELSEDEKKFKAAVEIKAKDIIKSGNAYEYIYVVWQSRVKGNEYLGKSCIVSRGAQSCTNSKGIHVYAHGKAGEGKSHGLGAMANLLPPERLIDGDISLKYLYYDTELKDSTTLNTDDLDLSDGLASLHKKITPKFQEGAEYRTIIEGVALRKKLPQRLSIWTSSVDIHGDEQHRDRWIDYAINEDQTDEIIEFMKEQQRLPRNDLNYRFQTEVCRYIYEDLAKQLFYVVIPYTDEYGFPKSEKTRGYGIFSDMIMSLAALRYTVRNKNESGHLIADPEDFYSAVELYESLHGHSDLKFTTQEKQFLEALIKLGREADVKQMAKQMNISGTRIRQIAN